MIEQHAHYSQLVSGLSQRAGLATSPEDGTIHLKEANGTSWAVVMHQESDLILIRSPLTTASTLEEFKLALELNEDIKLLRGAWLSLSIEGQLHFQAQLPLMQTTGQSLENALVNLMQIREEVSTRLTLSPVKADAPTEETVWNASSMCL